MRYKKACCHNKALGDKALGIVRVRDGYAIRCAANHRATIETTIYPAQAHLLGDLIRLNTDDADEYLITGVPDDIEMETLYNLLANSTMKWRCKPKGKRREMTRFTSTWNVLSLKGSPPA